jgi:glycosyltransferase involved in cell wall biosynthesis
VSAPTVSVVIPAYNAERFLAEALESVFAQTTPAAEVIVVDDGSTDATPEVARSFRAVTLIEQQHRGVSVARNTGVRASKGELIAFLDADDMWYPEKLELQGSAAHRSPDAGLILGLLDYRFDVPVPPWFRGPTNGTAEPGFLPSCWFLRRSCWQLVGEFTAAMTHGEDIDWLARARELGVTTLAVPEIVLTRRIHDSNAVSDARLATGGLLTSLRTAVTRKRAMRP